MPRQCPILPSNQELPTPDLWRESRLRSLLSSPRAWQTCLLGTGMPQAPPARAEPTSPAPTASDW
eukprot:10444656-Alexandrium_andersonii.AAC.1